MGNEHLSTLDQSTMEKEGDSDMLSQSAFEGTFA